MIINSYGRGSGTPVVMLPIRDITDCWSELGLEFKCNGYDDSYGSGNGHGDLDELGNGGGHGFGNGFGYGDDNGDGYSEGHEEGLEPSNGYDDDDFEEDEEE